MNRGKWGYIDNKGSLVIRPQFQSAFGFSDGLAAIRINDKLGYINKKGEIVIRPQYYEAGRFKNGIAPVGERIGVTRAASCSFIDKKGNVIPKAKYTSVSSFSEGLCRLSIKGEKYGYIDREFNLIIDEQFEEAGNGKWGYIDKTGKLVINNRFYGTSDFSEGLAAVEVKRIRPLGIH